MVAVQAAVVAVAHPALAMALVLVAVPDRAVVLQPSTLEAALATARVATIKARVRHAAGVRCPATARPASTATHNRHVKTRTWARMAGTACRPPVAPVLVVSPIRCAPAWTACWNAVAVAVVFAAVPVAVEAVPVVAHRAVPVEVVVRAAVTAADPAPGASHWLQWPHPCAPCTAGLENAPAAVAGKKFNQIWLQRNGYVR